MHFLGLAGMPRRVPDYPIAFEDWNYVSSVGSLFTFFSFVGFIIIMCFDLRGFSSFANQTKNGFFSGHLKTFLPKEEHDKLYKILSCDLIMLRNILGSANRDGLGDPGPWWVVFVLAIQAFINMALIDYKKGLKARELEALKAQEPKRLDGVSEGGVKLSDVPEKFFGSDFWQMGFQQPVSTSMESIVDFHGDMMFYLVVVTVFVLFMLLRVVYLFSRTQNTDKVFYDRLSHNILLEIV